MTQKKSHHNLFLFHILNLIVFVVFSPILIHPTLGHTQDPLPLHQRHPEFRPFQLPDLQASSREFQRDSSFIGKAFNKLLLSRNHFSQDDFVLKIRDFCTSYLVEFPGVGQMHVSLMRPPRDDSFKGQTVFMFPGLTTDAVSMWQDIALELYRKGFTVVFIDPLGVGYSTFKNKNSLKHQNSTEAFVHIVKILGQYYPEVKFPGVILAQSLGHFFWMDLMARGYLKESSTVAYGTSPQQKLFTLVKLLTSKKIMNESLMNLILKLTPNEVLSDWDTVKLLYLIIGKNIPQALAIHWLNLMKDPRRLQAFNEIWHQAHARDQYIELGKQSSPYQDAQHRAHFFSGGLDLITTSSDVQKYVDFLNKEIQGVSAQHTILHGSAHLGLESPEGRQIILEQVLRELRAMKTLSLQGKGQLIGPIKNCLL